MEGRNPDQDRQSNRNGSEYSYQTFQSTDGPIGKTVGGVTTNEFTVLFDPATRTIVNAFPGTIA